MLGTTLVAILTAAFLLPGLVGIYFFYRAGRTAEADPVLPALGSPQGLVQFGGFSIAVHFVFVITLRLAASDDPLISLPLADPYRLLRSGNGGLADAREEFALFAGLVFLNLTAAVLGTLTGQIVRRSGRLRVFHGPLTDILRAADGPNAFVTAYVLTKIEHEGMVLGYEGVVTQLLRDGDMLPQRIVLSDVIPFRIRVSEGPTLREPAGRAIDTLVLRADDWHNIAFRVYEVADEPGDQGLG